VFQRLRHLGGELAQHAGLQVVKKKHKLRGQSVVASC